MLKIRCKWIKHNAEPLPSVHKKEILILVISLFIGFEKSSAIIKDFLSLVLGELCEIPSFIIMDFFIQKLDGIT